MINVNDFKTGMTIKVDGHIYQVMEFQHVKPGKGAAFVKAKLKNLRTGSTVEITFNSSTKVEPARIERREMQYLYSQGDSYCFMNMETYEQVELSSSAIGDNTKYLKENMNVYLTFYEGELLGLDFPDKIELTVTQTEPAVKGNTTNGAMKDATLETGLTIRVPLFVSEGDVVVISTKDGKYVSRA